MSIQPNCIRNPAGFLAYLSVPVATTARAVLSLPAVTVTTNTPAAQAAVVYGCVSMPTRLDPWGSGAVEIAAGTLMIVIPPASVGFAQAHPLIKPPAMRKQPFAGLGPVTVQPTHSGVGPRRYHAL